MRPFVDHPTMDQDHDPISQMQRGLPIRDEKRGPLGHHAPEALVNGLLDLRVDRACCIVENEDARVRQNGAGQGDTLTLATRQGQATLPDDRVVPRGSSRMNSWAWATRAASSISSSDASGRP